MAMHTLKCKSSNIGKEVERHCDEMKIFEKYVQEISKEENQNIQEQEM